MLDAGAYKKIEDFEVVSNVKVEDFIGLIDCAKYVVTDSFHGVCLSIILNKQFYVTPVTKFRGEERLSDILGLFGLNNQWMVKAESELQSIDYSFVNSILKEKKEFSEKCLCDYLSSDIARNNTTKLDEKLFYLDKKVEDIYAVSSYLKSLGVVLDLPIDLSIPHHGTISTYLPYVISRYKVMLSVSDEASRYWHLVKAMINVNLKFRYGFAALIEGGKLSYDLDEKRKCVIQNGDLTVESRGFTDSAHPCYSLFVIKDMKIVIKNRGLNIVILRNDEHIVDYCNVDLYADCKGHINRNLNITCRKNDNDQ